MVDALLGSAVYAAQRLRAGRAAPDDMRVRALLAALLAHGGRLHDVVGIDADRVTVVLDEALLREQFRLGTTQ